MKMLSSKVLRCFSSSSIAAFRYKQLLLRQKYYTTSVLPSLSLLTSSSSSSATPSLASSSPTKRQVNRYIRQEQRSSFFSFGASGSGDSSSDSDSDSDSDSSDEEDDTNVIGLRHLVDEIAETHDLTYAKSQRIVRNIFDSITETIANDGTVRISKFGTFDSYQAKERKGFNFASLEVVTIPSKRRVRFKAYQRFKDVVEKPNK